MKTWPFLINPFLTASKKSYRQALKISAYHDVQLQAHISNPYYTAIYEAYHPLHLALNTAYSAWLTYGGVQNGSTLTTDQLLKLLATTKIKTWEAAVLKVCLKESSEYFSMFPNGLYHFNASSIENRIAAVQQLSKGLNGIPQLEGTKKDVDKFYNQLTIKRQTQSGNMDASENKNQHVETAILNAMVEMYGNLGLMMNQFRTNPKVIETFFHIDIIHNHEQLVFKKAVKSEKVSNIMEHSFGDQDNITLINDGGAALQFYLASAATTTVPMVMPLILFPNTQQTVAVNELGDLTNKYLNVYNGEINDGHCTLEMI